jgi:CAAX prenyl protease-like protein
MTDAAADAAAKRPWLPYVAPMTAYMLILLLQTKDNILLLYPLKTLIVAGLLWVFHNRYAEELKPSFSPLDVAVGLAAIVFWILVDPLIPYPRFKADIFNPTGHGVFIGFRVIGAVMVVPLMEELFWRGFLIRWLVDEDFKKVPIGLFTRASFTITVALFSMEHSQWLAGLVCGVLYNWLYYRRKTVFACVVAHATSNAALAAWVLACRDWKFW